MKKASIILAVLVSLSALYQFGELFCSKYAKAADLSALTLEVRTNALKQDTQYLQDRMWAMEDRYGYKNLNDKSPDIPTSEIHRYHDYKKRMEISSALLKELMKDRIKNSKQLK